MKLNPIALAIPVLFAAIGVELWLSRRRKQQTYRFADAISDLGCGIGNQVMALTLGAQLLAVHAHLYERWSLIRRLPRPLEWVFNTPSHHRVHHAVNPQYLDRNYGAILNLWDRLFGTFEPEREPCVYGVTKPFRSFTPVWANFAHWVDLFRQASRAPSLLRGLRVFVARPGWDPQTGAIEPPPPVDRAALIKYDVPPFSRATVAWVVTQFALVSLGVMTLLLFAEVLPRAVVVASGAMILAATLAWSGILERRRWAWALEESGSRPRPRWSSGPFTSWPDAAIPSS